MLVCCVVLRVPDWGSACPIDTTALSDLYICWLMHVSLALALRGYCVTSVLVPSLPYLTQVLWWTCVHQSCAYVQVFTCPEVGQKFCPRHQRNLGDTSFASIRLSYTACCNSLWWRSQPNWLKLPCAHARFVSREHCAKLFLGIFFPRSLQDWQVQQNCRNGNRKWTIVKNIVQQLIDLHNWK